MVLQSPVSRSLPLCGGCVADTIKIKHSDRIVFFFVPFAKHITVTETVSKIVSLQSVHVDLNEFCTF